MVRLSTSVDQKLQALKRFRYWTGNVLFVEKPRCRKVGDALCGSTGATLLDVGPRSAVVFEAHANKLFDFVCFDGSLAKLWVDLSPESAIQRQDELGANGEVGHAA
jgi:hypothetical protein